MRALVSLVERELGRPSSAAELLSALVCSQPTGGKTPPGLARKVRWYAKQDLADLAAATAELPSAEPRPRRGRPRGMKAES